MERLKPSIRARRILWGVVIFLALIGVFVVARRTARLLPILISANRPPTTRPDPAMAQFSALDDIFARYPVLTLIHILPWLGLRRIGAIAVQLHIPQTLSPMASA